MTLHDNRLLFQPHSCWKGHPKLNYWAKKNLWLCRWVNLIREIDDISAHACRKHHKINRYNVLAMSLGEIFSYDSYHNITDGHLVFISTKKPWTLVLVADKKRLLPHRPCHRSPESIKCVIMCTILPEKTSYLPLVKLRKQRRKRGLRIERQRHRDPWLFLSRTNVGILLWRTD